jgi:hypothetical protein
MSARHESRREQPSSSRETTCEETLLDPSMIVHGQASSDAAGESSSSDTVGERYTQQAVDPFDPFRCRRCGELIGVYEPLAVAGEEGIRITSRAAEPELDGREAIYFHRDCFESDTKGAETTRRRSAWRRASEQGPPA